MKPLIELLDRDIKTVIMMVIYMFKKAMERFNMLSGERRHKNDQSDF